MIATERWFIDAERSRAVRDGDPAAAFLLAGKGTEIPAPFVKLVQAALAATSNTSAPDEPDRQTRVVKPLRRR